LLVIASQQTTNNTQHATKYMNRDLFAREALVQIPKLLTLLDRNAHSPTYGCFDRNFWQYKIIDFPSGMAQEFVWPLALAYDTDVPDNPLLPAVSDSRLGGGWDTLRGAQRPC
jgi:hypothetical protein